MKTLVSLTLLWLCASHFCTAQLVDAFTDSNFHAAPAWLGDSSHFTINHQRQLQLLAPSGSARSQLRTASQAIHGASWEWWSRLAFNPSSTNYADVYLVSDESHLDGPLNGYFVRLGNTTDEVSLYRQSGSTRTKIIDGRDGLLNRNDNPLRVKVARDAQGLWQLWTDSSGTGQQYVLEGTASDLVHGGSRWFGLRLVYTATRADKFYLDDFEVVGGPVPDTLAPLVTRSVLLGDHGWELKFSEWPRARDLLLPSNYQLIGWGAPSAVQAGVDSSVYLEWQQPFASPALLELDVQLSDSAGNVLDTTLQLLHRTLQTADVVINELMADPTPVVGLPEGEFVELYNPTDYPLAMGGWLLSDPGTDGVLPDFVMQPKTFVLLVPPAAASLWTGYGPVLEVQPWPLLNNDQDWLRLRSNTGLLLDSMHYQVPWLGNVVKQQGGWSYERVSTNSDCIDSSNWKASQHPNGGSPGQPNSIFGTPIPPPLPQLQYALWLPGDSVLLQFSQAVQPGMLLLEGEPLALPNSSKVAHQWKIPLPADVVTARSSGSLVSASQWFDCHGQISPPAQYRIGKGEMPMAGELLFNEIYYRPTTAGTSYFELFNGSNNSIDLSKTIISAADNDWQPSQAIALSSLPFVLFPNQYMVFCRDTAALQRDFGAVPLPNRLQMSSWPTLNQSGGRLVLLDQAGQTIHQLLFNDSLHHPLLSETRGMALERLEGSSQSNFSSAQTSIRGTPGQKNSRTHLAQAMRAGFTAEPASIRPDQWEQTRIQFSANSAKMLKIDVLDTGGKPLATLLPLQLCTGEMELFWDGTVQGAALKTGAYLLQASFYDENGETGRLLQRIVINRLKP